MPNSRNPRFFTSIPPEQAPFCCPFMDKAHCHDKSEFGNFKVTSKTGPCAFKRTRAGLAGHFEVTELRFVMAMCLVHEWAAERSLLGGDGREKARISGIWHPVSCEAGIQNRAGNTPSILASLPEWRQLHLLHS